MSALNNSMNTYKMVKLESVLQDIYRVVGTNTDVSQDDLLESAASAMSHLYNYKLYERVIGIGIINNHKVVMPDFYQVDAVMYRSAITEEDIEKIGKTVQIDLSFVDDQLSPLNPCDTEVIGTLGKISRKQLYQIKSSGQSMGWNHMTLTHSIATVLNMSQTMNSSSDGCGEAGGSCEYTYSLSGNVISTSQKDGLVLVVFTRTPRDADGDLVIPVIPLVNEALKSYVLMEIHERDMNMHVEGAMRLYDVYFTKWERLSAAAIGELNKLTYPEWIELVKQNRFFKDDSPFRGYDKAHFERTDIGWTDQPYTNFYY